MGSGRLVGVPQTEADSNVILFGDDVAPACTFPGLLVDSRGIYDLTLR